MSRHFPGVSFPSQRGHCNPWYQKHHHTSLSHAAIRQKKSIKSITIPDGVNVTPVIGNFTIPGGVSHCRVTCEGQRLLNVWGCVRTPYVPTQCNQPPEVANAGGRVLHISLVSHIASSRGRGNSAQPENFIVPKIPEAAQWWS